MARYEVNLAPGVANFAATPLARVLGTLVGRWAVLTLDALDNGHDHFNELQRCLDGISHKVLIDTLRSLQRDGYVHGPLTRAGATGYCLTSMGAELVDLVDEIRTWGDDRWIELAKARVDFDVVQRAPG